MALPGVMLANRANAPSSNSARFYLLPVNSSWVICGDTGSSGRRPTLNASVYHRKLARVLDRMGGLYTVPDILDAIASGKV